MPAIGRSGSQTQNRPESLIASVARPITMRDAGSGARGDTRMRATVCDDLGVQGVVSGRTR